MLKKRTVIAIIIARLKKPTESKNQAIHLQKIRANNRGFQQSVFLLSFSKKLGVS
jgi:hypothetical protein